MQGQGAAALGAVEVLGAHLQRFSRAALEAQIRQRDLAAQEEERRILAVVQGGEGAVLPGEIRVAVGAARFHGPGDLAFGAVESGLADLAHGPESVWSQVGGAARMETARRGQCGVRRLREGQVEAALGLRQPAPAAIIEGEVPLVPHAAEGVLQLDPACECETPTCVGARAAQAQGRTGVHEIGHLADQLGIAVCASGQGLAVRTDSHHGPGPEVQGGTTAGAGGERAHELG